MRIVIQSLILLICGAVQAQEEKNAVDAKNQNLDGKPNVLQIHRWPGKHGPLKAGFVFDPKDYAELNGFVPTVDDRVFQVATGLLSAHIRRTVILLKNQGQPSEVGVQVEIRVLPTSTDDAHQALLDYFSAFQIDPLHIALKFASTLGLQLGDVSFVPVGSTLSNIGQLGNIEFVRNNVVVILTRVSGAPGTAPDLSAIAREMDQRIKNQQDYTAKQLPALFPVISSFVPQVATIHPMSSTPVSLTATDPRGQKLEFQLDASFGSLEGTGAPPALTYFSNERTGTAALTCICIDEGLLFVVATANVTVQN
jgi:hypothetical protein